MVLDLGCREVGVCNECIRKLNDSVCTGTGHDHIIFNVGVYTSYRYFDHIRQLCNGNLLIFTRYIWIGCGGQEHWPSRYPDLNGLVFCL